ncbi:hypothetical protein ACHAW5_003839 [Stephanodiscus triporus]|uniref:Arginine kinase n=1 Tax=Stephanodiscus triporus TaxID=2934178 RepID=A0ABD3N104_9STRA
MPEIWYRLSRLRTLHGMTIEDVIRPGLALPLGENLRVGVTVGGAVCYEVFCKFLDPIIREYHGIQQGDLNFEELKDPELPMECNFLRRRGLGGVFAMLTNGVRELERELCAHGHHFVHDARLGYLMSCPTNVGTAMRASVHVRLTNLGQLPGFFDLVERLKLQVQGKYGETDRHYTGVFNISNLERLGKSEVHLINIMVEGVSKLIELERRLEAGEVVDIDAIARVLRRFFFLWLCAYCGLLGHLHCYGE